MHAHDPAETTTCSTIDPGRLGRSIDLARETAISTAEAAARVPSFRPGCRTHVATIHRWILHGVRGVRLEAVRLGGRWVTTVEALDRFARALTAASIGDAQAAPRNAGGGGRAAAERADLALTRMGL